MYFLWGARFVVSFLPICVVVVVVGYCRLVVAGPTHTRIHRCKERGKKKVIRVLVFVFVIFLSVCSPSQSVLKKKKTIVVRMFVTLTLLLLHKNFG